MEDDDGVEDGELVAGGAQGQADDDRVEDDAELEDQEGCDLLLERTLRRQAVAAYRRGLAGVAEFGFGGRVVGRVGVGGRAAGQRAVLLAGVQSLVVGAAFRIAVTQVCSVEGAVLLRLVALGRSLPLTPV